VHTWRKSAGSLVEFLGTPTLHAKRRAIELTIDVVRSQHGVWELSVVGEPGVHGHAHLLSKLDKAIAKMLREEMHLDPADCIVSTNLQLEPGIQTSLSRALSARGRLEGLQEEASWRTREAVAALRAAGISYRDTARLLNITHQRVYQLIQEIEAGQES